MTTYINTNLGLMVDGENVKVFTPSASGKSAKVFLSDDDFRSKFSEVFGFDFNPDMKQLILCVKPGEYEGTLITTGKAHYHSVEDYLKSLETV